MAFGIALMIIGALGAFGLAGLLVTASSNGAVELGALATIDARVAAVVAAAIAFTATAVFVAGFAGVLRTRGRRAGAVRVDTLARDARDEARARLLELRLETLQREVEQLETRQDAALGTLQAPSPGSAVDVRDDARPELVLVEDGEPTELSRRLAAAPRARRA